MTRTIARQEWWQRYAQSRMDKSGPICVECGEGITEAQILPPNLGICEKCADELSPSDPGERTDETAEDGREDGGGDSDPEVGVGS